MKITSQTTQQQYQEWLRSNPTMAQIKEAIDIMCGRIRVMCSRIVGRCRRILRRTNKCALKPMGLRPAVKPTYYNHIRTAASFKYWIGQTIPERRLAAQKRVKALSLNESMLEELWVMEEQNARLARLKATVDQEIAMEQTLCAALAQLSNKN